MSIRFIYRSALIVLALLGISSRLSLNRRKTSARTGVGSPPQAAGQLGSGNPPCAGSRRHTGTVVRSYRPDALRRRRVTARRHGQQSRRRGSTVWHGKLEAPYRGEVTLAAVDNALAGSVTMDGRMFEIASHGNGLHEVREVNPALFTTEDPPLQPDLSSSSGSASGIASGIAPAWQSVRQGQIDVMVVWTPAARNAVGGTAAAIQSLVDLAVANANASYANSQIATTLRVVYSGEVNFAETPGEHVTGSLAPRRHERRIHGPDTHAARPVRG